MARKISPERRTLYYFGMALSVVGFILFVTGPFSGCNQRSPGVSVTKDGRVTVESIGHWGDIGWGKSTGPNVVQIVCGFVMFGAGTFLMTLARKGPAGTGLILDPDRERKDMEPWSRMKGGMLEDALDEAGVDLARKADSDDADLPFDEKLRRLEVLKRDGLLSESEYQVARRRILDAIG